MTITKNRNAYIDIIRGLTILLVVLGHTMTGSTSNSQNSFLYNIIWSLQIPLFFLISGYVTKFSKAADTVLELLKIIIRRSISYILPWIVWTFIIRGIVFDNKEFLNLYFILWNLDSGYWFLFSIWVITILFNISLFISNKVTNNSLPRIIVTSIIYSIEIVMLLVIGKLFGFSFLCIKLTIYYMPFYYIGFIFGKIQYIVNENKQDVVICLCSILWIVALLKYNLYEMPETIVYIAIRFFTSLFGCISICGLLNRMVMVENDSFNVNKSKKVSKFLEWIGNKTLEVYLIHSLVINLIKLDAPSIFMSLEGITITFINFTITLILCCLFIKMIDCNNYLRKVLFAK